MSDSVVELLAEEGLSGDAELGSLLFAMRSEATSIRPVPSAAVAALMPRQRGRRALGPLGGKRRVVTGLIVLGSLGIGAGAAAASPDVRSATQQFAQVVLGALGSGQAPSAPLPASNRPGAPRPSGTGVPAHPTPTKHRGSGDAKTGGSHVPGSHAPSASPGKGSPSAHPAPSPSGSGRSHHR